jgi:hypothetical protein
MKKPFQSRIEQFEGNLWGLHFKISHDLAEQFLSLKHKRVIVEVNGCEPFRAGIMFLNSGLRFININKRFCKTHDLSLGSRIEGTLSPDESKYGMEMPEEFEIALTMEPEADRYFHALTPGKMRNLIYFCNQTKSSDIRSRRAWVVCNHLISHRGEVDFKDLSAEIKEANAQAKLKQH